VTHFLAGLGTSGTFIGTARRLKSYDARIRCISMQPDLPLHGLEGMKHMASAVVPGIYDPSVADEEVVVGSHEAQDMARRLAREEGLLVGVSAGANVFAAVRLARTLPPGSLVVTVLCDAGSRYLSDDFWTGDTP
jgi:S-sulfo-L-cysteine synthase (O-acetyl-L-serine-dependent)